MEDDLVMDEILLEANITGGMDFKVYGPFIDHMIFHLKKIDENIKPEQPAVVFRSLQRLDYMLNVLKESVIEKDVK